MGFEVSDSQIEIGESGEPAEKTQLHPSRAIIPECLAFVKTDFA